MSNAEVAVGSLAKPPLIELLGVRLEGWLSRSAGRATGYHEAPPADVYEAILKEDPAIQPETLARMFW